MSKHTKSPSVRILNPLIGSPDHTNLRRANSLVSSGAAMWVGASLQYLYGGQGAIAGPRVSTEVAHRSSQQSGPRTYKGNRGSRCILTTNISLIYEE